MSSTNPPDPNVNTFNNDYWIESNAPITQAEADKRYLRFPTAQGTENLKAINVGGIATFNADIVQSNSESNNIVQQNITTDGNQNVLRTTDMFGTLRLKRPTSANGGDLLLYDVTGSSGDFTQFYLSGSAFAFKNLAKGGKIGITLQDNNNAELDPLTLTQSSNQARVGINNTNPACTLDVRGITNITSVSSSLGTNTFAINDTGSSGGNKSMLFYPNATAGTFNPLQQNGDNWIVATTGTGINTANLTINTWAAERNGMRITALTTSIYGGNNDYIKVDGSIDTTETVGTNLSIQNTNVSLTSSIPPTSSATQPAPTDSSTKIPTTAWVQSAIAATPVTIPQNLTINSVGISANPNPGAIATSGIANQANQGGFYGQYPYLGAGTSQGFYAFVQAGSPPVTRYTSNRPIKIDFISSNPAVNPTIKGDGACCTFELDIFFYDNASASWGSNSGAWGQTSCKLQIFSQALISNWGDDLTTFGNKNLIYNINNQINGNGAFNYADITYAPNGRQYWSYNQTIASGGNTVGNAYLSGANQGGGVYRISIYPIFPNTQYDYYYSIRILSSNATQVNGNGVVVYS